MDRIINIINGIAILFYVFAIAIALDIKNPKEYCILLFVIIHGFYWFYKGWVSKLK